MNTNKVIILIVGCGLLLGAIFYMLNAPFLLFDKSEGLYGSYVQLVGAFIGGCLVIYGLFVNNKRVEEQIRQNNLMEKTLISNRFKDASTLLGSNSKASMLAGIYALNQIALESYNENKQKEYVKVVHDIFIELIRENSIKASFDRKIINTLLNLVFEKEENIYGEYSSDLHGSNLCDFSFSGLSLRNVSFENCRYEY